MPALGQFIKAKREAAGLSQKKLGQASGISDSEIMRIENGTRKCPNWDNLCRIARVLNFHPFEILLAAGYISDSDIHPICKLQRIDELASAELADVQHFIDFTLSKRDTPVLTKEDC